MQSSTLAWQTREAAGAAGAAEGAGAAGAAGEVTHNRFFLHADYMHWMTLSSISLRCTADGARSAGPPVLVQE